MEKKQQLLNRKRGREAVKMEKKQAVLNRKLERELSKAAKQQAVVDLKNNRQMLQCFIASLKARNKREERCRKLASRALEAALRAMRKVLLKAEIAERKKAERAAKREAARREKLRTKRRNDVIAEISEENQLLLEKIEKFSNKSLPQKKTVWEKAWKEFSEKALEKASKALKKVSKQMPEKIVKASKWLSRGVVTASDTAFYIRKRLPMSSSTIRARRLSIASTFCWFTVDAVSDTFSNDLSDAFLASNVAAGLSISETGVTLVLLYFLTNNYTNAENPAVLSETTNITVTEEITAPLVSANLGTKFSGNGSLYIKLNTLFAFIFLSNLRGRVPYSDTATSSLVLTVYCAIAIFLSLNVIIIQKNGIKHLFSLFVPAGCPFALLFILVPIERISYIFRIVSLAVRLFANRIAGHTLIKVLIGFSFTLFRLGDLYVIFAFLPAVAVFALVFLEIAVAAIQAYIFTVLTCLYIKDIYGTH